MKCYWNSQWIANIKLKCRWSLNIIFFLIYLFYLQWKPVFGTGIATGFKCMILNGALSNNFPFTTFIENPFRFHTTGEYPLILFLESQIGNWLSIWHGKNLTFAVKNVTSCSFHVWIDELSSVLIRLDYQMYYCMIIIKLKK